MIVGLVGTGLIGSSIGLALKGKRRVLGFDPANAAAAHARGAIDVVCDSAGAVVRQADLVIFAVPVGAIEVLVRELEADFAARPDVVLTDVGSTKISVMRAFAHISNPARFVGGHPIAGTEKSGPAAASATLFAGKTCILTPAADSGAYEKVRELWQELGARVVKLDAGEHDRILAHTSHLPHVVAFALAAALSDPSLALEGLAAGGFLDTTRIAASDPIMWRDIFVANRGAIERAIETFDRQLYELRRAIAGGDGEALVALIEKAHAGRERIIKGRS